MKHWIDPPEINPTPELLDAAGGHRLLAELLAQRGLTKSEDARRFLDPDAYKPASPFDLPDMDRAVERIRKAIGAGESIAVWGDFDVDGQTSTALLVSALRELDGEVTYHIPRRETEGHGVHIPRLKELIYSGVQLIVTCDTGVTAHQAVEYANRHGVDVIITDHHQLPAELPAAHAVVNPQRLDEDHPLHTLPGVGCAYKLIEAMRDGVGGSEKIAHLLDLVALGIVADVAEQTGDTRYLLQRGLQILRCTERLGLRTLMETAGLAPDQINESHISFVIGPRLNALGRLADANDAVELLTTDDLATARILSNRLEALNADRRTRSNQIFQAALEQIERDPSLLDHAVLVLAHDTWPGGIVGIVASRLADRYHRPVILLTAPPGELARGSARSVPGCDITAAIAAHADMLAGYGGHSQAAGLSLPPEHIPKFRRAISRTVETMLAGVDRTPQLEIAAYVALPELSLDLVDTLEKLAPFGMGNPAPVLATRNLRLNNHRSVGRDGEHIRLMVEDDSGSVDDVIWWQADRDALPFGRFDLAYIARANDYQGGRQLQLEFVDVRLLEETSPELVRRAHLEVIDCRGDADPLARLQDFGDVIIWREGDTPADDQRYRQRHELSSAPALAIWTTPPGQRELQSAIRAVNPETVILFGLDPGLREYKGFLREFVGVVTHILKTRGGQVSLVELAAGLAHCESTVHIALRWLEAKGDIDITSDDGRTLQLVRATQTADGGRQQELLAGLKNMLNETAAYRNHFRRADKDRLIEAGDLV
jgi:single-stranded-DNA-specific exonuclease